MGVSTERNVSVTKVRLFFTKKSSEFLPNFPFQAVFGSLEENQEYWVQISGATSQGRGPFNEKYSIKTEKEMLRAPTNVLAMSTSDSTAEVSHKIWDSCRRESQLSLELMAN